MEKKPLQLIGYRAEREELYNNPYYHPSKLQDREFWARKGDYAKLRVVQYLDLGIPCNFYRGLSPCRLCDELLGSCEKTDGFYTWPEKLSHYITKHNVTLPDEFIEFIMNNIKNKEKSKEFWLE